MKPLLSLVALALLVPVAIAAQEKTPDDRSAQQEELSPARQALKWSQERLAELDAEVAVLEKDAARLQGDAKAKGEAQLKALRARRDEYRAGAARAAASASKWTEGEVDAARKSLDQKWAEFESARDEYLATTKAGLETRRAVLDARLQARRASWRHDIDALKADAVRVEARQRAAIDGRITRLYDQADEARARAGKLEDASAEAWEATKKGYAQTQQVFAETYASVRKSIEEALE